tara:strand:- start:2364 stop:2660 length:297 start_codon:yes stop_codon:yes gene_type:complete
MPPKQERRVTTTFRLPESDKIKIENMLAKQGETWQSYLEPMAYSVLNKGKGKKFWAETTKDRAIAENAAASIELLEKAIVKLQNLNNNKGYRGIRTGD